jgi:hypothetical protein
MLNHLDFSRSRVDPAGTGAGLAQLAALAALGGLLTLAWRACCGSHQRRRQCRPAAAPAAETRWEAEGGRPLPEQGTTPE